ncbi:unnamed protein product [Phytophthora lilii]|uniref:Unnamed protein product n=1 Tax=Phytophthora lilii TaxID=2077276 RepID=A0A9W6TFI1_9STRA|nr:unnamed protein product [Phytophthora lilii]
MIATLVVQPPSLHEGGDLVLYRDGQLKYRHDFGRADGTATLIPYYAVHYADAEHAVETVTKGYRLALVYSVCLPPLLQHLERDPNKPTSGALANAIETMGPGDDSFALLWSHEYTTDGISEFGLKALKGVDRARFLALEKQMLWFLLKKKIQFHIVELCHQVRFYGRYGGIGDWNEKNREENIPWYTTQGRCVGTGDEVKFNFLNPQQENRCQLIVLLLAASVIANGPLYP